MFNPFSVFIRTIRMASKGMDEESKGLMRQLTEGLGLPNHVAQVVGLWVVGRGLWVTRNGLRVASSLTITLLFLSLHSHPRFPYSFAFALVPLANTGRSKHEIVLFQTTSPVTLKRNLALTTFHALNHPLDASSHAPRVVSNFPGGRDTSPI